MKPCDSSFPHSGESAQWTKGNKSPISPLKKRPTATKEHPKTHDNSTLKSRKKKVQIPTIKAQTTSYNIKTVLCSAAGHAGQAHSIPPAIVAVSSFHSDQDPCRSGISLFSSSTASQSLHSAYLSMSLSSFFPSTSSSSSCPWLISSSIASSCYQHTQLPVIEMHALRGVSIEILVFRGVSIHIHVRRGVYF